MSGRRYLADRFEWAAPGDQQEDAWLVRFCDRDCGDAIFTGPDAEAEAWAYWERYAPSFNIYVFRLAALRQPGAEYRRGLREAADRFEAKVRDGYPTPASKVDQCEHGQFGWEDCIACYDQVLLGEIEAIRALSDSIPDTKGGRDG